MDILQLSHSQKINKRREWWRLLNNRTGKIFINGVTGTLTKYEIKKGHVMCSAWKADPNLNGIEVNKKNSEMHGRLWSKKIPSYINNKMQAKLLQRYQIERKSVSNIFTSIVCYIIINIMFRSGCYLCNQCNVVA